LGRLYLKIDDKENALRQVAALKEIKRYDLAKEIEYLITE